MNDMLNNRIKIEVIASGKSLEAHVLAVTRLSNEEVAKSINEVIEENGITYEDIIPPRSENSNKSSNETRNLIEQKMDDIGIEVYIYGFSSFQGERTAPVKE